MVLTKDQSKEAIKHILEQVLNQEPDSNLHLALKQNDIGTPHDIITLSADDINALDCMKDNSTNYYWLRTEHYWLLESLYKY